MINHPVIYLLINQCGDRTYVGFSDDFEKRIQYHKDGKVKTTKGFGDFKWIILEKLVDISLARTAEKYWKSSAGRKRIKEILHNR